MIPLDKVAVVTPFTGVWIEIVMEQIFYAIDAVTPFTGVWIEIGA